MPEKQELEAYKDKFKEFVKKWVTT